MSTGDDGLVYRWQSNGTCLARLPTGNASNFTLSHASDNVSIQLACFIFQNLVYLFIISYHFFFVLTCALQTMIVAGLGASVDVFVNPNVRAYELHTAPNTTRSIYVC